MTDRLSNSPGDAQWLPSRRQWIWLITIALLPPAVVMALVPPLAQDLAYHDFADQRSWLGIPNFANVISSLLFVAIGGYGLWYVAARCSGAASVESAERYAPLLVFAALVLTGLGSAWYHLQPDNQRLVWDRLPMTLVFMALFSMLISERVGPRLGIRLLLPLCAVGLFSVYWWASKDDLRAYAIVQFYPMPIMVFMLWRLTPRYTHGNRYWGVLAWYAAAKVCEVADARLLDVLQWVSGHSLKHVLASLSACWLLRMLQVRRAC